jgi:hypothetical protein
MPVQMIADKLSTGALPREDARGMFAGYGTGAPCSGCGVAIRATEAEYELVFSDERSFPFHAACVNLWRALKDAPLGDWRVTCSCNEWIGLAATLAEAEALEREHIAISTGTRRHVITIARR